MKKLLSGFLLVGLLGLSSQADMLRVEMGAGAWQNDITGTIESKDLAGFDIDILDVDSLGYDKETKGYIWMFIKHPVPILPNLRLEYTNVDFSGKSIQPFVYKGKTYTANSESTFKLNQFDIIMYYNLLDNTAWTTLDLGLDVKIMQGEFTAQDSTGLFFVNEKETFPVPMAYGRLRFELPFDIGLEGTAKYLAYKNSKITDYMIKADYTLIDILPVDIGLEVGYRFEQLDIDGNDFSIDKTVDVEIDGVFVGAVVRF